MSLLVVGSIAIDTVRTPDGQEHKDVLGGSCTYFSYVASFLTDVRLVGVVGEDFDSKHVDLLKNRSIDLTGLETRKGESTFRWAGTYSEDMNERTTDALDFGVLGTFDPNLPETYRNTPYVFLACAQPAVQLKVMDQMTDKPFIVLDTIEFYIENELDGLKEVLKRSNGIIINDGEVKMLTGRSNLIRAAEALLEMGPSFAVVKKGEHGCLLVTPEAIYPFPAYPLKNLVDPTGAGDSFAGGFMGYLAQQDSVTTDALRRAVVYGTTMASFTCEGISLNRLAQLDDEEVKARVKEFLSLLRIPE